METSLHRALKDRYAAGLEARREVRIAGFRIDAIDDAGRLDRDPVGGPRPAVREIAATAAAASSANRQAGGARAAFDPDVCTRRVCHVGQTEPEARRAAWTCSTI